MVGRGEQLLILILAREGWEEHLAVSVCHSSVCSSRAFKKKKWGGALPPSPPSISVSSYSYGEISAMSWPSFAEMVSKSPPPEEEEVEEAVGGALVVEPEVSMMDYAWNEDDIDIDFMTGG